MGGAPKAANAGPRSTKGHAGTKRYARQEQIRAAAHARFSVDTGVKSRPRARFFRPRRNR